MSGDRRPWTHHLRLLPGGDADVGSALVVTLVVYVLLLFVGLLLAIPFRRALPDAGGFTAIGLANALPCAAIALWTGLRVWRTQPIGLDEAAAWPARERVFYGGEVPRVPLEARVVPLRPRRATVAVAGDRRVQLTFRVNDEPVDLLALAAALGGEDRDVEALVLERLQPACGELLPDVEGVRQVAGRTLLPLGLIVTRGELSR